MGGAGNAGVYLLGGGPANSYMVEFKDWVAVFDALREAGYSGWLSIDHLDGPADELLLRRFAEDARTLAGAGLQRLV